MVLTITEQKKFFDVFSGVSFHTEKNMKIILDI